MSNGRLRGCAADENRPLRQGSTVPRGRGEYARRVPNVQTSRRFVTFGRFSVRTSWSFAHNPAKAVTWPRRFRCFGSSLGLAASTCRQPRSQNDEGRPTFHPGHRMRHSPHSGHARFDLANAARPPTTLARSGGRKCWLGEMTTVRSFTVVSQQWSAICKDRLSHSGRNSLPIGQWLQHHYHPQRRRDKPPEGSRTWVGSASIKITESRSAPGLQGLGPTAPSRPSPLQQRWHPESQ